MGHIFALEGVDGSGKTSAAAQICTNLADLGYKAIVMRAPGATKLGEALRAVALNKDIPADSIELMLIFGAAARSLMREAEAYASTSTIHVVVLDRCYLSDLAYRNAEGLGFTVTRPFIQSYVEPLLPKENIFYLRVPVEVAERRLKDAPSRGVDRFESKKMSFRRDVIAGYDKILPMNLMTVVDGTPTLDVVVTKLMDLINKVLP